MSQIIRLAMSSHDTCSPLSPDELRKLADETEEGLINHECGFSHPDWRLVDGAYSLAYRLEELKKAVGMEWCNDLRSVIDYCGRLYGHRLAFPTYTDGHVGEPIDDDRE